MRNINISDDERWLRIEMLRLLIKANCSFQLWYLAFCMMKLWNRLFILTSLSYFVQQFAFIPSMNRSPTFMYVSSKPKIPGVSIWNCTHISRSLVHFSYIYHFINGLYAPSFQSDYRQISFFFALFNHALFTISNRWHRSK